MDHDDGTESEGNAPQNEIANEESLRGNSTEKSVAEEKVEDGGEAKSNDTDNDREMMDLDDASGVEGGNMDVSSVDDGADEASGVSDVEPPTGNTTHASLLSNDTPDGNEEVGASEAEQQQQQSDADMQTDNDDNNDEPEDQPPNGEPSADVGNEGEPTHNSSEAPPSSGEPIESTAPLQQPSDQLETSVSADQSSAQPGPDMSMEEDDTDVKSDKAATTTDVTTSEGGGTTAAVKSPPAVSPGPDSKRKPLEDAYGPYIHLDDTCLEDARERLHSAIEQTRLLREALTEQAYERYRCVVKPAPDTLDEIIDPIRDDPIKAGQDLAKKAEEIKVEKELERTQAEKAGVVPEELAYFGEGLHLVILPEDEVDEDEIDLSELPTRGPIDPETGEIVEDLKNAYANATEQVFERIRRIRAIRMGGDINEVGKQQEAMKRMKLGGGVGGGQQSNEPVNSNSAGYAAGYAAAQAAAAAATKTRAAAVAPKPSSSPAPSFASDDSDMYQKGASQHLLTLAPNAEGIRPDGSFTAVQSALVARGVGMHETQHDLRINPKYQRMIQPNYFSPTASQQLLPPLLRPHDLYRLQAADARRKGVELGLASAKTSIKSVVEDIFSKDGTGTTDNSSAGSNGNIRKSLEDERSAMEIGLMRRMHTASGASEGVSAPSVAAKKTIESLKSDQTTNDNTDNADPSLAFSVMNAVGILRKKEDEGNGDKKESSEIAETGIVKAFGLDGPLSGLESVSKFLGNGVKTTDTTIKSKPDSSSVDNGGKQEEEEVAQIRGGGGQDESNTEETKSQKNDDPLLDYRAGLNAVYGSSDPYHTASLTAQHQLNMPLSHLPLQASNMSDLYLQNSLASVAALRQANPNARADILAQHPQLSASLGLIPGQTQHDMMLWEHHNAAATAAAAAQYQAALAQNPLGGYSASSLDQSIAALQMQRELLNRKRSFSMSESKTNDVIDLVGDSNKAPITRAASAPPSPLNFEKKSSSRKSSKKIMSQESFDIPSPPQGVSQDIADLITHAKFHKARSLYKGKEDDSEALLIQFLLSLSAAVPISKDFIAEALTKKLKSSHYKLRLHEFVGNSTSACASRDVIIAIISIWLWAEHKDCLALDENESEASFRWLIDLAIDKSLSALASFFDSRPSKKSGYGLAKDTPNEQVAAIASKSLADQVCVDHRADASFPMMEDLLGLLDNLRTEALQAKTQERVLLAALASRCGSMSEAFSNAYVSSIVRAGVALGHENVCEMGQDEGSRASTMLPYDYFHDAFGVWEEPCRPATGFHSAIGSDELKKRAHARSVIQKSMKKLQSRLGLQGGILDGGPYFPMQSKNKSKQPTMAAAPPIQRSASGSLKRRASYDDGAGQESNFNPEHYIAPMMWNPTDISNLPYGQYEGAIPAAASNKKKRKLNSSQGDVVALSTAAQHCSSQEYEWEDVANMFFQGAAVDYDFSSNVQLGKKKIYAPYVNDFDRSTLSTLAAEDDGESSSDEDISDETMLQRHQKVLDDMKIKLDAALESRKHHLQSEKKVDGRKDNGRKKKSQV